MAVQTYAIINSSGVVENIILWDGESNWEPPAGCTAVASATAKTGDTYANGVFTTPDVTATAVQAS